MEVFSPRLTSGRETAVTFLQDYNLFYESVRESSIQPLGSQRDFNVGQFTVRVLTPNTTRK